MFSADKMSVRTSRPPPPRSKPPPPPPSFAPPPLPETPSLSIYQRNEKINPSETVEKDPQTESVPALPPKFRIEEVNISEVATQPQASVLRPETFNFSLRPRKDYVVPRGEDDDLAPEIRNKCQDVNAILNRILSKDEDFDIENKIEDEIELSVDSEQSSKTSDDPFLKNENIADLTLEEVRDILEKEEHTNASLKEDLVSTKEEKLTKHPNLPTTREKSRKKSSPKPRKSKKEQQLEKLMDFLKDPDANDDQVVLDVRLKKSGKDD